MIRTNERSELANRFSLGGRNMYNVLLWHTLLQRPKQTRVGSWFSGTDGEGFVLYGMDYVPLWLVGSASIFPS